MSGKAIIILVSGIIIIAGIILYRIEASSTNIVSNVNRYFYRQSAQNISQSGVNMGLRQLANDGKWRTGFGIIDLLNGKVSVTAFDTTFSGRQVVAIRSVGIVSYNTSSETRATSTAFVLKITVPFAIKGLVTTGRPTSMEGNPLVDARDHTAAGVLVPNSGTIAVWTTSTMSAQGNPSIGGTVAGVDIAPSNPYNPALVQTTQSFPNYPTTPDSVLGGASNGYPEGTLKARAQSGIGGSQYTTNPATLTYPLKGITYVELPSGGLFQNTNITGSGILIVHNSAKNAIIKNCNLYFTGLVLVDDSWKEMDIAHVGLPVLLGAVFGMTPNASSTGRWGNSDGSYVFSSEAIINALQFVSSLGSNGSAANVIGWWE